MNPAQPDIQISDVVLSTAGHDQGAIFYVIGSILVLGAVVLLVTKKRMGASK